MVKKSRGPPGKSLWAYAYDITLPPNEEHLIPIQNILDQEHTQSRATARTWAAQVVVEPQVTRILVVSDSRAQNRAVNRRIEAELKTLDATFDITVPVAVGDDLAADPTNGRSPGNGS